MGFIKLYRDKVLHGGIIALPSKSIYLPLNNLLVK